MSEPAIDLLSVRLGNPEVISVLEAALVEARAGRISGLAIVTAALPQTIGIKIAGEGAQQLAVGCAQMERMLLDAVFKPQRMGGLLMPAGRG